MELWQFLGDWHPRLVQFPLVLLLAGLLLDLAGVVWRSARARWAGLVVSGAGTMGLLFAFICGIYAEIWAGRAGVPHHPMELHELAANIASWGFVILFAWRILMAGAEAEKRKSMVAYVGLGLGWYMLLALTAYLGGQLVFEYGAGVRGVVGHLSTADLNTLATRQTDENLRYSEWMHHIFGWMTLGLAVSLLAQALVPKQVASTRWIVSGFLLAGGIFLFFMADRDLYALSDWRQWRDREVQLHKSLAVIMCVIGAVGLWRLRPGNGKGREKDPPADVGKRESNSKLVAVMALIGGAMLFTHVHTVAPYANVAAGVYIYHVFMGVVALAIGAARLAQDFLPRWKQSLAVGFGALMLAEAVLLVTYNEGLPWFIGYGRYERWGPDRGKLTVVAPFGNFRAVMLVGSLTGTTYTPDGSVHIGFRERFEKDFGLDDTVKLTLDEPPVLLISRGNQEIALPLKNDAGPNQAGKWVGSLYQGQADFLKHVPLVNARLVLRINGRRMVGTFDPWVTPLIQAVPPNEVARFSCPMHQGVRARESGKCVLCGMELSKIKPPREAGELHDAAYAMTTAVEKAPGQAAALAARLVLSVSSDGKRVPLAIVHEQVMHVMIVSQDLQYFDHVHPSQVVGGKSAVDAYYLDYVFPQPGNYVLFADVTPAGDRGQVFRVPLQVDAGSVRVAHDEELPRGTLTPDAAGGKLAAIIPAPVAAQASAAWSSALVPGNVQVQLLAQPRTIYAGLHSDLVFTLSDAAGQPVTDLSPYLGAMGHCVVIAENTRQYVHLHPEQLRAPVAGERGGPQVVFGGIFPKAGRYRLWAQFRRGDKLIYGVFTVDVKAPWIPAGVLRALLNE